MLAYQKPLDANEVKKLHTQRIKDMENNLVFIDAVFKACQRQQGKRISKRIATDIQKLLPAFRVRYNVLASMYQVKIEDENSPRDNTFSALICYDTEPTIDLERVKKQNVCYTLDDGRIENTKRGLPKVDDMTSRWNKALAELKAIHKEAESFEMEWTYHLNTK